MYKFIIKFVIISTFSYLFKILKMKKTLLTFTFAVSFTLGLLAQSLPEYVSNQNLVAWYPFSGNANDNSLNAHNGKVFGATLTTDRFGNANSAYSFNGVDNWIGVFSINNTYFEEDYSISAWVLFNNFNNSYPCIINGDRSTPGKYPNWLAFHGCGPDYQQQNRNKIGFYTERLNDIQNPNGNFFTSSTISVLQWHHMVVTRNKNIVSMYIDGKMSSSINTYKDGPLDNGDLLSIGMNHPMTFPLRDGAMDGKIDDIGIWSRALTELEISDLYFGGFCKQTLTVTDTLVINVNLTNFNPIKFSNKIKIYPNPAMDHIIVDYGDFDKLNNHRLQIINSINQTVFETKIYQQTSTIDLRNWGAAGLYLVLLLDDKGNTIEIRKIVIQ